MNFIYSPDVEYEDIVCIVLDPRKVVSCLKEAMKDKYFLQDLNDLVSKFDSQNPRSQEYRGRPVAALCVDYELLDDEEGVYVDPLSLLNMVRSVLRMATNGGAENENEIKLRKQILDMLRSELSGDETEVEENYKIKDTNWEEYEMPKYQGTWKLKVLPRRFSVTSPGEVRSGEIRNKNGKYYPYFEDKVIPKAFKSMNEIEFFIEGLFHGKHVDYDDIAYELRYCGGKFRITHTIAGYHIDDFNVTVDTKKEAIAFCIGIAGKNEFLDDTK